MKNNITSKKSIIKFDYDQALAHIKEIFPESECKFDESCIDSFGHIVKEKKIVESYVFYNKIAIQNGETTIYWPIQPYKLTNPQGIEFSYFDLFKSY